MIASNNSYIVPTFFSNNSSTVASDSDATEMCSERRYLAMYVFSFFTIPAFSRQVKIKQKYVSIFTTTHLETGAEPTPDKPNKYN
jgi:hypothetical protein